MRAIITPPRWIHRLLRRFADEMTLEEVEGDLLEFYPDWVSKYGRARANTRYLFTVITLLRPFKRKAQSNITALTMIRSYFVMSWRTILKNRVSSLINLSGLTLGLTTSLLVLLVVLDEFEYDRQHVKIDSIFMMMKNQKTNEGVGTGRSTAGPLAETLKSDYSQVVRAARVARAPEIRIVVNDNKYLEQRAYVDPDLFRMMTFKALKGDAASALDKNEVVLSKSISEKFFKGADALGQTILVGSRSFTVGAIIEDIPSTNTLKFQIAIPFKSFEKDNDWLVKWDDNRINTWVELNSPDDLDEFNQAVAPLITEKTKDPNEAVFAYPLSRLHLYGGFSNGHPSGGLINVIYIIVGFGVFLLLVACVNFMNIATAQSMRRAKEVGVRKVLGAMRRWIIFQFLNEALVVTFFALIVAVVLTIIVIPSFNVMMHTSISFDFNRPIIWILCLSVAIVTALVSGSYPALVLSRFIPVRVLKGINDRPGGLSVRRVLVTFQFVISISALIGTIVLYRQFDYVKSRPLGYDQQNLISIPLDSLAGAKFDIIKEEVSKIPGVTAITSMGGNILYSNGGITGLDWPGKKPGEDLSITVSSIGYEWSKTMGIQILSGRDFDPQFPSDKKSVLINLSAVNAMRLTEPVGSVVGGNEVVGVFKDFVYNNPSGTIAPMMIFLRPDEINNMYLRIENNKSWMQTMTSIEKTVRTVSPDMDFDFRFTTDEYQSRFEEMTDVSVMVSIFGGVTIFISCLGLFGLAGFIAERRSKEMSIRKVFGADSMRVLVALSADILKPVGIALLIVIPLSVWIAKIALEQFVYRVSLSWWMFTQAGVMVLTVAFLVVFYHGWRAAVESPAVRLKSE
jgi:putative ABC transport system permease protein